jgi:hypothetical protein
MLDSGCRINTRLPTIVGVIFSIVDALPAVERLCIIGTQEINTASAAVGWRVSATIISSSALMKNQ